MEWYLKVIKNYVGFSGRARRTEYWMFYLINTIITISLMIVDYLLRHSFGFENKLGILGLLGYGPLYLTYAVLVFLPKLAVAARRLHDTGNSAWFLLISLVPCIGSLVLLILMVQDGTPGSNQYGENPKLILS